MKPAGTVTFGDGNVTLTVPYEAGSLTWTDGRPAALPFAPDGMRVEGIAGTVPVLLIDGSITLSAGNVREAPPRIHLRALRRRQHHRVVKAKAAWPMYSWDLMMFGALT